MQTERDSIIVCDSTIVHRDGHIVETNTDIVESDITIIHHGGDTFNEMG